MNSFAYDCLNKFRCVAREKNRSFTPWKEHDFSFLLGRLKEEVQELQEAIESYLHKDGSLSAIMDECKDVALFAWFVWARGYDKSPPRVYGRLLDG